MTLTPKTFKSPMRIAVLAATLAFSFGMMACAGNKSKSSSSDYSSLGGEETSAPKISPSQERVDEAKRSAEEAEQKAHELRAEKAKAAGN